MLRVLATTMQEPAPKGRGMGFARIFAAWLEEKLEINCYPELGPSV